MLRPNQLVKTIGGDCINADSDFFFFDFFFKVSHTFFCNLTNSTYIVLFRSFINQNIRLIQAMGIVTFVFSSINTFQFTNIFI